METTSSVSFLKIELSTVPVSASHINIAAFFPLSAVTINLLSFSESYIVEQAVIALHYKKYINNIIYILT
jgi:hypothetical protein